MNKEVTDDFIFECINGNGSVEDNELLTQWRKTDVENEQRFQALQVLWASSTKNDYNEQIDPYASLQRLKAKIPTVQNRNRIVSFVRLSPKFMIAASILLFVCLSLLLFRNNKPDTILLSTLNAIKTDTLADGSVLTLNRNTKISYPSHFDSKKRLLTMLNGEAFFNITHKAKMPFIISTGKVTVQVLGTSFNVKSHNEQIEVIVETGMVAVMKDNHKIFLKNGEKVFITPSTLNLRKETNTDQLYKYYRTGQFIAKDTPLWRVIEILNGAFDTKVVISDKSVKNLPLNATFQNESLENILSVICETFDLQFVKSNQQYLLKKRSI